MWVCIPIDTIYPKTFIPAALRDRKRMSAFDTLPSPLVSLSHCDAHNQECNLLSRDSQRCHGRDKQERERRAGAPSRSLRWDPAWGCAAEMLICYSVCLWHDEKHSFQIHWRRSILERDWSCCSLAWQQSRAWRLTNRTVLRKRLCSLIQSKGERTQKRRRKKKTAFLSLIHMVAAVNIAPIKYLQASKYAGGKLAEYAGR